MKITIIDGSTENDTMLDYTEQLSASLRSQGFEVNLLKTRELKINFCNGCWTCWWATPGQCVHRDDMEQVYRSYANSDLMLHYSPMSAGFISSRLKNVNDRTVPIVLPYVELVQGECHHKKRYDKYPALGLIVHETDNDKEDLEITRKLYERMAINLRSSLKVFVTTNKPMEEITHAISHI